MTDTDSKPTGTPPTNGHKDSKPATVPHVVIVGGGFGGLTAAKKLGKQPVRVTLIDRNNYHLFQPMLYQVSTSGLAPADIARSEERRVGKEWEVLGEENRRRCNDVGLVA